jgi:Rod binding domain-containing protein
MTAAGGIGIAKMISKQLHKAEDAEGCALEAKAHPAHPGSQRAMQLTVFKASTNRLKFFWKRR